MNYICSKAKLSFAQCQCTIKDSINSEMSHCDGKGSFTIVVNPDYSYCYPCRNCKSKQSELLETIAELKAYKYHGGDPKFESLIRKLEEQLS